ncbi:phosphoglycerate dehydrogenase [Alkaliphilus hydrothermalis]|uniref:Phosphoglycerate dehydrogenase-like enzyme n=1 Tax=Alkaliphilus hydrothermalis TaxID=1482730 RepID=A0ABS2NSG2_9FIRM|nr:phosphoglycerate dehydrogenase [Alkaliphilus hydrothermalis]MBM7615900.1 phosphoglycerate dehydrogenase-like enzyme [Alkaliphilus hydrothermalis]
MKALFTYDYGQENMEDIKNLGYDIMIVKENEAVYQEAMKDVEVLVCYNPFSTLDVKKMTGLRWIQLSSIGVDQAPMDTLIDQNVILTNNKGGYSIPMGEWVVLKMLEIYKKTRELYQQQDKKQWRMNTSLLELYGKKVTFIGTGSIAQESAKRLQGFGVEVLGINTRGTDTEYFHKCYPIEQMKEILEISDVVVVTVPYTDKTHHMLNRNRLMAMKKNAVLINVSRGSIIDEAALIQVLSEGHLMGIALDVFEEEPLSSESPLWEMENVLVSPHNSWISEMRNERRFQMILENMKRYINKEKLLNVVDLQKGY